LGAKDITAVLTVGLLLGAECGDNSARIFVYLLAYTNLIFDILTS
jgi:hypothetical protein